MDSKALLVTALIEAILAAIQWWKRAKVRASASVQMKWELLPYDFSDVDWLDKRSSKKIKKPHSRRV
jgi:hypothetical protein